jgi:hypothetical protein
VARQDRLFCSSPDTVGLSELEFTREFGVAQASSFRPPAQGGDVGRTGAFAGLVGVAGPHGISRTARATLLGRLVTRAVLRDDRSTQVRWAGCSSGRYR